MKRTQEKLENEMNETTLKYYKALLNNEKIRSKSLPKAILNNSDFQNMLRTGIINKTESGNGFIFQLNDTKKQIFLDFFNKTFPNSEITVIDKATNIAKFKNSKSQRVNNIPIIFIKGKQTLMINNQLIDLNYYTQNFGFFATQIKSLQTEKLCFVENKETFLAVEKLFPDDYVFIHIYGRVGKNLLENLKVNELLVFSDYDYVGLNEYLKFKEIFVSTEFFIPKNFDFLFSTFSTDLAKKGKNGQRPSLRVLNSTDEIVVKVREQIQRTHKFLEQEILLYEC